MKKITSLPSSPLQQPAKNPVIKTDGTTFYMNKLTYISNEANNDCISLGMLLHTKFVETKPDPLLRRVLFTTFVCILLFYYYLLYIVEPEMLSPLLSCNIPVLLVTGNPQLKQKTISTEYNGLLKHVYNFIYYYIDKYVMAY